MQANGKGIYSCFGKSVQMVEGIVAFAEKPYTEQVVMKVLSA